MVATKGSVGRWDQHGALTSTAKRAKSASGHTHKHPWARCRTPLGHTKAKSQHRCVVASHRGKFSSCSTKLIPPHLDSIPRQNKEESSTRLRKVLVFPAPLKASVPPDAWMPERTILGREQKKGWLLLISQQEAGPQRINDSTTPDLGFLIHSLNSPFHQTLISGHCARSWGARRVHKQEGRMFELQKKADLPLVVYKLIWESHGQ